MNAEGRVETPSWQFLRKFKVSGRTVSKASGNLDPSPEDLLPQIQFSPVHNTRCPSAVTYCRVASQGYGGGYNMTTFIVLPNSHKTKGLSRACHCPKHNGCPREAFLCLLVLYPCGLPLPSSWFGKIFPPEEKLFLFCAWHGLAGGLPKASTGVAVRAHRQVKAWSSFQTESLWDGGSGNRVQTTRLDDDGG